MGVRRDKYSTTYCSQEALHVQETLAAFALMLVTLCGSLNAKVADRHHQGGYSAFALCGTMAISETTLKDVMLMLIDEQNKKAACLAKSWSPWWLTQLFKLAALCRKSPRAAEQGQGCRRFRLLDLCFAQVCAARV